MVTRKQLQNSVDYLKSKVNETNTITYFNKKEKQVLSRKKNHVNQTSSE